MDILESKLFVPHLDNLLPRQRLSEKLANLAGKRLVLVTAGAGYGKTTLAAQVLSGLTSQDPGKALVWYRLDRFDRDVTTFAHYLIKGLETVCQNLSARGDDDPNASDPNASDPTASDPDTSTLDNDYKTFGTSILKTLESITDKEIFIVLDDYHLLGLSRETTMAQPGFSDVHDFMDFVLERLPSHVRFVIISRAEPPLKLSSMRVRRQIVEIHEPDLVFTLDETADLFLRIHNQVPKADTLSALHEKTGGWAAGIVLFGAALGKGNDPLPFSGVNMSRHYIFNFLEENLFENQPRDMQRFMTGAALMDPMETKICDKVLGVDDSQSRFRKMMALHLMVFPMDEDETLFHYHHLFRDFLLEKLNVILDRAEIRQLHLDIAACLQAEKNPKVLVHYIKAEAWDDVVRFMDVFEFEFLVQGKIEFIRACLEKIPTDVIAAHPGLLFMEAKQFSYFGRPDKSIASLTAACRILRQKNSDEYVAKCLVDLGAQYYYTGHIPEARDLMIQVLDTVRTDPGTYTLAITYLSFFCTVLGDMQNAEMYETDARAVMENFSEFEKATATAAVDTSKIYLLYTKGDFEKSMDLNLDLIDRCKSTGFDAFLPLAFYHASATDSILGRYETGRQFAQQGIRAAKKINLRDSQTGWIYIALAENHLGLKRMDTAVAHANTALKIFRRPGNRWGMANALDLLAKISLAENNISDARTRVTKALDIINGYGLPMAEAIISNTLARVLMASKNFEQARTILAQNRRNLTPATYHLSMSLLLEACCCHASGRHATGDKLFQKGLAIARQKNFDRLVKEGLMIPEINLFKPGAGALFSAGPETFVPKVGPESRGLNIQAFGGFRLVVAGREIDPGMWPGTSCLILFQYLAVHRAQGNISKDVLVEMLWPDQDPVKTGKRFNTAMSQLRRLLEPDLLPRAPSTYIVRKNDQYSLCLGPGAEFDLDLFHTLAEKALKSLPQNRQTAFDLGCRAEHLYKEPVFGDALFKDWYIRLKEETQTLYCKVCRMLTKISRDIKDPDSGIMYAQKLLTADPFDESMYRQLIAFFIETGRHGQAAKTFLACEKNMKEMACALSPKTLDLMKNIKFSPDSDKI